MIAFGVSKERWWREQVFQRTDVDATLAEGLTAYALEHADTERAFVKMLQEKWATARLRVEAVLADLAKPGFPETVLEDAVAIDVDIEDDDDLHEEGARGLMEDPSVQDAYEDNEDGQDMEEVERIA